MTQGRRTLRYDSFESVMPDVERLLRGHVTVGRWSLAQICRHLSSVMNRVIDLPASTPIDRSQWTSEEERRGVLESGSIPEGLSSAAETMPGASLDERDEAGCLKAAIERYQASSGPVIPHRFYGYLTRAEWDRLQLIHIAHHLSFAIRLQPRERDMGHATGTEPRDSTLVPSAPR